MSGYERYWHTKDYYKELEIDQKASERDIKKAYRRLALKWHPDKCKEEGATEKFKALAEAFEVLKDKSLRSRYDRHIRAHGVQQPQAHSSGGGHSGAHAHAANDPFHDEMSQKFGGGFTFERAEEIFKSFFGKDSEFSTSHQSSSTSAVSSSPIVGTNTSTTTSVDEHGRSITVKITRITRADGTVEEKKEFEAVADGGSGTLAQQPNPHHHHQHNPHDHQAVHAAALAQQDAHMAAHNAAMLAHQHAHHNHNAHHNHALLAQQAHAQAMAQHHQNALQHQHQ